jgi:DNA sulfur modification protein DndC
MMGKDQIISMATDTRMTVQDKQPSLWEGFRQTMTHGIEMTAESLNTYGSLFDDWVVCFSGGKDSSCVASLVPSLIEGGQVKQPKSLRFLYADTRMELPPLRNAAMGVFDVLRSKGYKCDVVLPEMTDRFFVYMFGRGVPPPSNTFRWCTAQIKVEPMMKALKDLRDQNGKKFLMLTGVRVGESAARDARIALSCGKDGAECGQGWFQTSTPDSVADTLAPILHWRVCHVWKWLRHWAPMGGYPTERVADSYGGVEAEEINARTGCVGCNLASRDVALETLLKDDRWKYLHPLMRLRPLYAALKKPQMRLRKRERELRKDGTMVSNPNRMGPLTLEARRWGMQQVIEIQDEVNSGRPDGDPEYLLIDAGERAAIESMIDAQVWPNGWTGNEGRADLPFTEINKDGSVQEHLFEMSACYEEKDGGE